MLKREVLKREALKGEVQKREVLKREALKKEVEGAKGVRVTYPIHKYIDRVSSRTSSCGSSTSLWLAPRAFSHFLTILHRQFVLIF